jgi:hypothetical protein
MRVLRDLRVDPFAVALVAAVGFAMLRAVLDGRAMADNFATMDNDDILRLVMVRDLIAGQGWFDLTQYRLLPPAGVVMHWSRYIDAGIAAMIVPLSGLVGMDRAEQLAVTLWPTLIFGLSLLVIGYGTRRVFGSWPACFALAITVIWPTTGHLHAGAGNIDHHNVQMLMMTIVAFALIWPVGPVIAGVIGGIAAAFSLAVGLETLPFIIVAGAMALGRHLLDISAASRGFLLAFCLALAVAAVLFWLGQTAPALRAIGHCDRLSLPALALIAVAVTASLLAAAVTRFGALAGLAAAVLVTVAGCVLIWPHLGPCLDGPYGDLPAELQVFIATRISEALPLHRFIRDSPAGFVVFTLPVIVAVAAGGIMLWRGAGPRMALTMLWVFCLLGLAMTAYQMRSIVMAGAVVPMLGGVVIARALEAYLRTRAPKAAVIWLVLATTLIAPMLIGQQVKALLPDDDAPAAAARAACRDPEALAGLNALPPAVFLAPMNLGPALLWATHHDVVSAGYHVDPVLLMNAVGPYHLPQDDIAAFLRQSGASLILVCRGAVYDNVFARSLAAGAQVDWLRPVPMPVPVAAQALLVFEILPQ